MSKRIEFASGMCPITGNYENISVTWSILRTLGTTSESMKKISYDVCEFCTLDEECPIFENLPDVK